MELQTLDSRKGPVSAEVTGASQNNGLGYDANTSHKSLPKHINDSAPLPGDADNKSIRMNVTGTSTRVTHAQQKLARLQFATLLWTFMLVGWNDGTTGSLLPRIQEVYHVGVYINKGRLRGCIADFRVCLYRAVANMYLTPYMGFGKTFVLAALCQVVAYSIQAAAPPFPVFVLAYTINGVGMAIQEAQAIGFVATLSRRPETKMGILHACYGLGALLAPLAATHFAQLHRWSFHFLISLGIAVSNTILLILVFEFKTQDQCLALAGETIPERVQGEDGTFKQVMMTRSVHLFAFFILIYVGVEVTIGGWIVTFIIDVRKGGSSSGFISSGFFGGLCAGRILLLWVNKKVGERLVLFVYAGIAIALELTIWFVPSLLQNAVAVSIVGALLGPMYPIVMNQAGRILPRWILTSSIGWIAGFGQAGSAVLPFLTGVIAQKHGIKTLQPLLVGMMTLMTGLWAVAPRTPRRID